jgi:hypothetical protein
MSDWRMRKGNFLAPRTKLCETMLRCEGTLLRPGKTMCRACELASKKPVFTEKPPRGEHHLNYEASRAKTKNHDNRRD